MRPIVRAVAALTILFTATGCALFEPDEGAERAVVSIVGSSSVPLALLTSTDFVVVLDPETSSTDVELNSSDTSSVASLPFNQTYGISLNDRFFVRLSNPDTTVVASVRMSVSIDGQDLYDASGEITGERWLEFVYRLTN